MLSFELLEEGGGKLPVPDGNLNQWKVVKKNTSLVYLLLKG